MTGKFTDLSQEEKESIVTNIHKAFGGKLSKEQIFTTLEEQIKNIAPMDKQQAETYVGTLVSKIKK